MKTATCKFRPVKQIPYPNAATRSELFHRLLDAALVAAGGMGIAAMLLLMSVLQ